MSYRGDREMHDATCGDCGKQCQVPFEPRQDKPVYCNECFPKHKPANLEEVQVAEDLVEEVAQVAEDLVEEVALAEEVALTEDHEKCTKLPVEIVSKDCEVPFEPRQDKPVYCNECFQNHKRN